MNTYEEPSKAQTWNSDETVKEIKETLGIIKEESSVHFTRTLFWQYILYATWLYLRQFWFSKKINKIK